MTGLAGSGNLNGKIQFLGTVTGDPVTIFHATKRRYVRFATFYPERATVVKDTAFGPPVR